MAQLNFEIPDDQIGLAIDMLALRFGPYPTEITVNTDVLVKDEEGNEIEGVFETKKVPNPTTKAEFVRAKLAEWAMFAITEQQRKEAMKTAEQGIELNEVNVA